jgi:hypothetical protein
MKALCALVPFSFTGSCWSLAVGIPRFLRGPLIAAAYLHGPLLQHDFSTAKLDNCSFWPNINSFHETRFAETGPQSVSADA